MRVWSAALSVGALSLASLASGVVVDFNKNFMSATPTDRITFATSEMQPLRQNLLMTMDGLYSANDRVSCNVTSEKINSGIVTVLLAISKCLNASSIELIESWVDQIKDEKMTYFKDGGDYEIDFTTTLIPGQCEARSESNKKGFADKFDDSWQEGEELLLLSDDVQAGEIDRISAFARFGRVLDAVPSDPNDIPIAVISFVNNEKSFDIVSQYEREFKISNTFNFQLCRNGESCTGHFENCLFLQEGVDLFMYNPFTIVQSFHCSMLDGGIPVSYVDDDGARQCFCACPLGYEQRVDSYDNYVCEQVIPDTCPCTWSTHPFGFKHENTEYLETCYFSKISSEWGVPAPFPSDNYVADSRVNDHDDSTDLENGPHIDVSVTPQHKTVYDYVSFVQFLDSLNLGDYTSEALPPNFAEWLASIGFTDFDLYPVRAFTPAQELGDKEVDHYSWRDYQVTRESKIDDLSFTAYGRYLLEVDANDYSHGAQCKGCVAIVDKYRPKHTTQCPVSFCDNTTSTCEGYDVSTSELLPENVDRANALVQAVYAFQSEAKNDACSSDRCDYEDFSLKNFFEDTYCSDRSYSEYGPQCFNLKEMEQDLFMENSKILTNPLVTSDYGVVQDRVVVPEGQCTRCCSYTTKLREFWTDYTCGYDYDTQRCSGDESESCSFNQCLVLFGETIATAAARINPEIVDESQRVIDNLVQKGFQTHTQIHRALDCSSFNDDSAEDGACSFTATVSDLIDTQVRSTFLSDVNANDYVFWRYTIGDSQWNLINEDESAYEFSQAETKITLEAWTQCGLVRKFYFYVHLHLNSDVRVCDKFSEMWYQTSVSRLSLDADLCAYPSSDFAELTFDYHPNVGLQYARDQLRMNVTAVSCSMSVQGRDPVEIVSVEAESPEIIERFAVELINNAETGEETNVHVSCAFTYTRVDDSTLTHTCDRDFTIVDCNGPEFDVPHGECTFEDCAGVDAPGPFEACGGKIVKSTAEATYLDEEEVECCQACGSTVTTCEAILGLPNDADDIKRCVPQFERGIYDYYDQTFDQSTGLMASSKAFVANNGAMTALLGASAMVAMVALVVVRRRRAAAKQNAAMDDVYFPLLH